MLPTLSGLLAALAVVVVVTVVCGKGWNRYEHKRRNSYQYGHKKFACSQAVFLSVDLDTYSPDTLYY